MNRATNNRGKLGLVRLGRYFWPQVRHQYRLLAVSFGALLSEVGLRLLEPWPLKFVFDRLLGHQTYQPRLHSDTSIPSDPSLLLSGAAVALVAITGLRALAAYWNTVGFASLGNRALTSIRADLFSRLQDLPLLFHQRARGGDLLVRVTSDVSLLQDVAVTALLPLLARSLILAGMLVLMFWMNWQLALLAVALWPLFWLRTRRVSHRMKEVAREQRQREGAMAATAAEAIGGIRTVQALSLQGRFDESFARQNHNTLFAEVRGRRLAAGLERSVDLVIAAAAALVLWQGTHLIWRGALTPGELLVFLAYLKSAFRPIQDFAKYTGRLAKASAAGERVLALLDESSDGNEEAKLRTAPRFTGSIRFEDVSLSYEPQKPALMRISLDIPAGQFVAVVGPSGSGKTSLVSLISRLYEPSSGRVLIDGVDVRLYTRTSVRGAVSVVLQDALLFATSIRDNIAAGVSDVSEESLEAATRLANAHDFIMGLPQGYDTVVGERGVTLSQGQRQRIAIARAAVRQSPILILDEPTTGLDETNEQAVMDAVRRFAHGRTTLLVTHKLIQAAGADRIIYLECGSVLESGTHAELLVRNGRYAQLYRLQLGKRKEGCHAVVC